MRLFQRTPSNVNITKKSEEPELLKKLWAKCGKCHEVIFRDDVKNNYYKCPKCGEYFRLSARRRIKLTMDPGSFLTWDENISTPDPLQFPEYLEKVESAREKTGMKEAVLTGRGRIEGYETAVCVMDSHFLMGSMGYAVGEKITKAVERATERKLPIVIFCCSGGARMQEGMVSLMQMAKTSQALKRHSKAGLFSVTVLTDPTTGGVTASFAMLGDVILAEPGALIGFAGPRVIEQTIRQKLPEGFQRAEFLLDHGFVDRIVERENMRKELGELLAFHGAKKFDDSKEDCESQKDEVIEENAKELQTEEASLGMESSSYEYEAKKTRDAWSIVENSRQHGRLTGLDYIDGIFSSFMELHGDRYFGDDHAIVGGIAWLGERAVTVIVQQKGRDLKENLDRNFSMPSPEGYRKALRLMKAAEKFGRPIICFVDTPGAFCGMEAEERGQGRAIADNLYEMSDLKVPVLSIFIGEGGSGGALAMGVANEVWMMENAVYSILSPEGFASILWKDSKRAKEAAAVMKITAEDLKKLGIIEKILPENEAAGQENKKELCAMITEEIYDFLEKYCHMTGEELANQRYQRFRSL